MASQLQRLRLDALGTPARALQQRHDARLSPGVQRTQPALVHVAALGAFAKLAVEPRRSPGKQEQGTAPEDGVTNYSLFLPKTYLAGAGTVLTLVLRGLPVSKAEFDPGAPSGVAPAAAK